MIPFFLRKKIVMITPPAMVTIFRTKIGMRFLWEGHHHHRIHQYLLAYFQYFRVHYIQITISILKHIFRYEDENILEISFTEILKYL